MAPSAEAVKNPATMSNSNAILIIGIWQLWRCPARKSKEIVVRFMLKMSDVIAAVPRLDDTAI